MTSGLSNQEIVEIYERYGHLWLRRCRLLLRDSGLAEDALHEALIKVMRLGGQMRRRKPDQYPEYFSYRAGQGSSNWVRRERPPTTNNGEFFHVAQDIPVTPQFPAQLNFDLVTAPPSAVMVKMEKLAPAEQAIPAEPGQSTNQSPQAWPENAMFAVGSIVVYEDDNGNGQLDLLELDAQQTIDKILGARQDLLVFYFQGGVPNLQTTSTCIGCSAPKTEGTPKLGYNLLERKLGEANESNCTDYQKWYQQGEGFDLLLSMDPSLNQLLCKSVGINTGSATIEDMGSQQPSVYPKKEAVTCQDKISYTIKNCQTKYPALCQGIAETCIIQRWHLPHSSLGRMA